MLYDAPAPNFEEAGLSELHLDMLRHRYGLSDEVIAARGYRTLTAQNKDEYRAAGWGALTRYFPALEIPLFDTVGRAKMVQIRPDSPRLSASGKIIKYELPPNEGLILDVNPLLVERVKGLEPLVLTEGVLKADSAISQGLCCIGLLGVWGFRGKNIYGGLTALASWQDINLKGRQVYIAFDSDVVDKPSVRKAMIALRTFLVARGAEVLEIRLQPDEHGGKTGLDDYFVRGGKWEDLTPSATAVDITNTSGTVLRVDKFKYARMDGCLCVVENKETGSVAQALGDFDANIDRVIIRDDGEKAERWFEITGKSITGEELPLVRVPAKDFGAMGWLDEHWGGKASLSAGRLSRDMARAAMHSLSPRPIPTAVVFCHTGWRKIDGRYLFLTSAGGLGENELDETLMCEPDGGLGRCALTPVEFGSEEHKEAVRVSLGLLNIGAAHVIAPVLAATYLAPLAEVFPINFVTHLVGRTGTFKTELVALAQAHFGDFTPQSLPGSWSSTANYMERQAFMAKDIVVVMDDFKPSGDARSVGRMHQTAEQFIRGIGNTTGRGRLTSQISARRIFHSRGLVISTGEDTPNGESLQARMAIVEVEPGDIDPGMLAQAQVARDSGQFRRAMAGYIQWLAPQIDTLGPTLHRRHREILKAMMAEHVVVASTRTPYVAAAMELGLEMMLKYAVACGAVEETEALYKTLTDATRALLPGQAEAIRSQDPANRFVEIIQDGLATGRCHLKSTTSAGYSAGLERFGWRTSERESRPQGPCVGWVNIAEGKVYLAPTSAFLFVTDTAQRSGSPLGLTERRLWRQLAAHKMLEEGHGHANTMQLRTAEGRVRVIALRQDVIEVEAEKTEEERAKAFEEVLSANAED